MCIIVLEYDKFKDMVFSCIIDTSRTYIVPRLYKLHLEFKKPLETVLEDFNMYDGYMFDIKMEDLDKFILKRKNNDRN